MVGRALVHVRLDHEVALAVRRAASADGVQTSTWVCRLITAQLAELEHERITEEFREFIQGV